jgi:type I restriction enzyme R subunit
MTNFGFLKSEWPALFESASKAEAAVFPDARTACFYARRTLELAVLWLYQYDKALKLPYQDHLDALLHEPSFKNTVGPAVFTKTVAIKKLGNMAVHSHKPVNQLDAVVAVRELFHVCYWLAHTYAKGAKPADGVLWDQNLLSKTSPVPAQTLAQLQQLAASVAEKDAKLSALLTGKAEVDAELEKLRTEIAAIKLQNAATPDQHDYSEAQTRDFFIDLLLKEAGWPLTQPGHDTEFPVNGMPNKTGEGFVDYVLWGDDGKPLGVVEAKRTRRSPKEGQQQAKLYADCLEAKFDQRPVIFYSNGYEHWMWDDLQYPPRPVQGFYAKDELQLLVQRRQTRKPLATAEINKEIVERYYQQRAIKRICEDFAQKKQRKALLVMATGAGKTRTVIALCDLLMRANWAKRVLFLADRVALVNQAIGAFKKHLSSAAPVNLCTEKETAGRVYVATYPTMMNMIEQVDDGERRFGAGHFDLIVIDEAHRSVYQKYRAIFDYFDSLLVGLTATPKDEIDHNTYSLFEMETGVPTDVYDLETAVKDGFLVPPKSISVPLKFQREGIKYDQLSEKEKEQWDELEWDEDGNVPDKVEAEAVNRWLFNEDTVDKVLAHLMEKGQCVADGDRLGKTIIFAKNHDHAEFIADRFNANYPHYAGHFARVIDFKTEYAQSLIDSFSIPEKAPHIAISVDMLDTGIDVPEVVNLVFFKLVRSKTKFWQMVGRGTRLRPDLRGPGRDKKDFTIFDYCQNLEFFSQNPETTDGSSGDSLGKKLFTTRVELVASLDKLLAAGNSDGITELRTETAGLLHSIVAAMNVNNFVVRPQRKLVEQYTDAQAWKHLTLEQQAELVSVAALPSELADEDQDAKQFDLLMLRLQLALLNSDKSFKRMSQQVRTIAGDLSEMKSIPMVARQMALILEVQTDEFWQDVTLPILENVRKKLRALMKLIERKKRNQVYTDFEDELGAETEIAFKGISTAGDFARFKAKALQFLKAHENDPVIHKLRWNEPLTSDDLVKLETMLVEAGTGTSEDLELAKKESPGLGLFVRSLVGLDRDAAKQAFGSFLQDKALDANQIDFINLIIDHLTQRGWMDASALYESPFVDYSSKGVDGLFSTTQVDKLVSILEEVRQRAAA